MKTPKIWQVVVSGYRYDNDIRMPGRDPAGGSFLVIAEIADEAMKKAAGKVAELKARCDKDPEPEVTYQMLPVENLIACYNKDSAVRPVRFDSQADRDNYEIVITLKKKKQ